MEALLLDEVPISNDLDASLIQSLPNILDTRGSLDNIALDIDLLLKSTEKQLHILLLPPKLNITRAKVVHSFAGLLFSILENLIDPTIPKSHHFKCVLEGYHSYNAAKHILATVPIVHYHLFTYIIAFLKEFSDCSETHLDLAVLSDRFAPILLCTPKHTVKSGKMKVIIDGVEEILEYGQYTMKRKMFLMHFLDKKNRIKSQISPLE